MKKSVNFEIELAEVNGANVEVFYFINDGELQEANISYSCLKEFAVSMGMNSYCSNELTGDFKYFDADIYVAENLNEVVKSYLELTHNPFEAIIAGLNNLIAA